MHKHPIELVEERENEFKDNHSFLGPTCMIPGLASTDANRAQMDSSHLEQRLQVLEPQAPLIYTGFENEWGKYSSGYCQLKGKWKVLCKIEKNDYNYDLIIKKIKNSEEETKNLKNGIKPEFNPGEYHVIQRNECTHLTEKYGYKHDNKIIDSLEKGDIIENNTVLFKDNNRDEEMNLTHGRNLNVVYLTYGGLTNEDAIVISESTSKKMGHYEVKIVDVSLNTNDIFVNMYGNKKFYKSFPDIGEDCKDGLLCATRRINYSTAPITLADTINLISEDVKYRGHGKVVDLQVISNIENPEEVLDTTYNKQIKIYYDKQQNYYKNFIAYVEPIVTNSDNKVSKDLVDLYNYYCRLVDPNNKFLVNDNLFDHLRIKFTILEECSLVIGSKLAGRYGDKGVVSEIRPDDEMPKVTDFAGLGNPDENSNVNFQIDMILNPLGVSNRLNPSQNIETEINYNSKYIRYQMEQNWNEWTLEEEKKFLIDYLNVVDKEECENIEKFMDNLSEEELEELLLEIIKNGIPVHQAPLNGAKNIVDLARIYNYTGVDRTKLKDITNTVIFGEKFMMTLKHIPASKFSARSVDQLSIKNIPVKSNLYKEYKSDYSTNAIKIGKFC
jgi:DNA-directed RNA polymerase beta subunit